MKKTNRRDFMKIAGRGMAAVSLSSFTLTLPGCRATERVRSEKHLSLGMASYTFRNFPLEETLAMTKRLGLKKIAFKSFHLPLESTEEEIKTVARKVKEAGLELYGCGVVYMENEGEVHRAFHYAQTAGMKVIIGVPEHELLSLVNQKVKEFDIQVAIHNHGPTDKRYPAPESAYERIKDLDQRIGLCIDVGHTQRCGVDPSESAEKFVDRLLDVHIKDVSAAAVEGTTVEIGRGVIDIPRFVRTLLNLNYKGNASFEFEKDADDPLPGVAESVGYVRGVLSAL
jgi:sugar phosphate isomerase/epimerase